MNAGIRIMNGLRQSQRVNLMMFIISYAINNLVSGILYDTYINYLQEVSLSTATSFWAFYGYATFLSALLLLLIPKAGYRPLLIFCSLACSGSLLSVIWWKSPLVFSGATLLALVGVQLHFIILAPFIATYTEGMEEGKIKWYTRAYYSGYIGYFLSTYIGGALTVKLFSIFEGISCEKAQELTRYVTELNPVERAAYLNGMQGVLLGAGILSITALLPVLFIGERKKKRKKTDTGNERTICWNSKADGTGIEWKVLLRRRLRRASAVLHYRGAAWYLLYWALVSFAMGLFSSYFTVYLNRNLHMDKADSSLLVSISYVAIVLFMFFTPVAVRKLGTVGTICFTMLASIPFMLIIAEGARFGSLMIPAVGVALFMRAGLANLGSPAESSLNMSLVPQKLRPAYTSLINVLAGLVSIASGTFTGRVLFQTQDGYRQAYYIAAALYLAACGVMFFGLRKYNRIEKKEKKKERKRNVQSV